MITGTVNPQHDAVIRLTVLDGQGQPQEFDAIVDTGFNGWLTLPPDSIRLLSLPWQKSGNALLADGSQITFDTFSASVFWDGQQITIPVDEADADPLVGMSLLYGYELRVQVIDGGSVNIAKI